MGREPKSYGVRNAHDPAAERFLGQASVRRETDRSIAWELGSPMQRVPVILTFWVSIPLPAL